MARIITITSGKGGVGKTSISLNVSLALASKGFKVCLFDADLGLANVNILTGIYPEKDLESVIEGQADLTDIIIKSYQGIDIIPGSSGVEKIADLTRTQTDNLISAFLDLEDYDYFIFDTSAGISAQVLSFCMASNEIILVATCEPTSLTDAYSLLKVLSKYQYDRPVKVVINQVRSGKAAQKAYVQLKETVNRFLLIKVEPLGIMASDKNVRASVISQTPFFMLFPDTIASKCINAIARKLIATPDQTGQMPMELFWDQCLAFLEKHHAPQKKTVPPKAATPQKAIKKDETENNPDISNALFRIEDKLSLLIKEVREIKQVLNPNTPVPEKNNGKTPVLPKPKALTLDFESWLKKRKISQSPCL
ncbi:MinD/ParA family protein [Desulfobacula toluolica]|uniref:Putative ParA family protein n=1 Tax=Desulfobacula toluolica (strain DSM 7467 / Tol2) TaxID=651182 RepID=K0NGY2_DESTT|nr:MinD/ParA family protein [Desulfobacula toluolica]CCK78262.1 putative ParA family protein [Desulfobacula toluolica Tol2]